MSEPLLEQYQRAAVSARIHLAGSPYHRMSPEEYDKLSSFSRTVIGMMEDRQALAAAALDAVLRRDPVVGVSMETVRRLDLGRP